MDKSFLERTPIVDIVIRHWESPDYFPEWVDIYMSIIKPCEFKDELQLLHDIALEKSNEC